MDNKIITLRSIHLLLAGFNAIDRIGQEAKALEATNALIVTDKGVKGTVTLPAYGSLIVRRPHAD